MTHINGLRFREFGVAIFALSVLCAVESLPGQAVAADDEPGIIRTDVGTFDLRRGTPPLPEELRSTARPGTKGTQYFFLATDPVAAKEGGFDRLRDAIVSAGGAFVGEAGNATYLVRLTPAARQAVEGDPVLVALEPYHPAFKLSPRIGRIAPEDSARAVSDVYKLDVRIFPGEDVAEVASAVRGMGGSVLRADPDLLRIELHRSKLAELAAIEAVLKIDEEAPIVPWGEETTTTIETGSFHGGAKPYQDAFVNGGGLRGSCSVSTQIRCQGALDCPLAESCIGAGSPQILMAIDTGIQLDAADLSDTRTSAGTPGPAHRKVRVYQTTNQFGGSGDLKGCDAPLQGGFTHGHVVASTALGNATVVPLRYGAGYQKLDAGGVPRPVDGVAPRAVLVAYDAQVTPLSGSCSDPANSGLSVGAIYAGEGSGASLEVSYHTHGARTFDFPWGTTNNPFYGANANSIDNFLQSHKDAMLFVAAGNEGRDSDGDAIPDPGSISDPATAKNAVVVGASGNTSEPFNGSNEQDRSPISSVGPATSASARIAPLLMAPGTDFGAAGQNMGFDSEYACRSNDNNQLDGVECDLVQGLSGTSFASAAAAGAAMLVRDYFAQGFYPDGTSSNPGNVSDVVTALSGAEVKAILVASADWMDGSTPSLPSNLPGDNLSQKFRFNREQGYGRIQLDNALPLEGYAATPPGLLVADGAIPGGRLDIPGLTGDLNTGAAETDTGTFTVCDDARELRVALAWIDSPGEVLNRNLDLELRSPSGKIYYGDYFTDDNNRNGFVSGAGDCPAGALTGSTTALDESPWSLPVCPNAVRDNKNTTEAIFLSPDARLDGAGSSADKQTETGTWTILVRTGAGSTAAVQSYAVAVAGGVCLGSSVRFDQEEYVCNAMATIVVDEKDEASDPQAGLTDAEVANRTVVEVVDPGPDRSFGTPDDVTVDTEDATSGLAFTHVNLRFSATLPLTDGTAATPHNGTLDVRDSQALRVRYQDESGGSADTNKLRRASAAVACRVRAQIGGVVFPQIGMDTSELVEGGCERDARGLFTFGFPDRYVDSGERVKLSIAFQNQDSVDLLDVRASLRCVLADSDSPEGCHPGTAECADPDRRNNAPCGSLLTVLDTPKEIGDLPAGQVGTVSFTVEAHAITGTPEVDWLLSLSSRKSGRAAETLLVLRNTLNVDEQSLFYSTDFPTGGTQIRDWPVSSSSSSPSDEIVENPTTNPADPGADYRFDTIQWSSLQATGRNLGIAPWNFESGKQGFTVGLNNTSTQPLTDTVANWGEDKNFNGVLDWYCSFSTTTVCPGGFPSAPCGRCSNNSTIICSGSNAPCGGGGTSCLIDASLGTCISNEDRDPQNGLLDDNWSTAGGCGWQTNGTTNSPTTPGGVWHTGHIGAPVPPCLVTGNATGACQNYEVIAGQNNTKKEWEILLSPEVQKVNQCTTDLGPLPPTCQGRFDTPGRKVFTVEFMNWAWNMSMDLKDRWAQLRYELDTDTRTLSPIDLFNDDIVLGVVQGNQGPISGGDAALTDGFPVFAPFSPTGASQNGTVGKNRVGRNPCYFETSSPAGPFHFAQPLDDDVDNNSNGQVDEFVEPNGPIRNFGITVGSDGRDMRFDTLEDVYGPSGESFRAALGFRVFEGNTMNGVAQPGYGVAVDDMVIEWREYSLVEDATDCATSGACATVEADSSRVFDGNGTLTITVTDSSPYRCTGGPPCVPEGKNDCDHDGSFAGAQDDDDCNDDGIPDVVVKATSVAEPAGEFVVLDRVGTTDSYRGTLPMSLSLDAPGVLLVSDASDASDVVIRYDDLWDGTTSGSPCRQSVDPAKQGFVTAGVNLIVIDTGAVDVISSRVDDQDGDHDGFADTGETADLYITVRNRTGRDLTHLVAGAQTGDPKIDCIVRSVITLASLPAGATVEIPVPFTFHVAATADRGGTTPPVSCSAGSCSNGAGPCSTAAQCQKTANDDYSAAFAIALSSDQFELNAAPQRVVVGLDLDSTAPVTASSTFVEGFETGSLFGTFQQENLDYNIASNSASDGMRCQYTDPDFINSSSYGVTECYLGFQNGQVTVNDWHLHGSSSPDGGRAYLGNRSVHYGIHTPGNPNLDTYGLSQMDALRSKNPIRLATRICRDDPSADKRSCNVASDCVPIGGGPCVPAQPQLSFEQQISTVDSRCVSIPEGQVPDRAIAMARLDSGTTWKKLQPYVNVYDAQATDAFANCMFDPTDDGNDEDSYFDPTDPNRRLGPSSTCYPEFAFGHLGDTNLVPFSVGDIGRASDGPGLAGSIGPGTWVQSRFDLGRYRGRSILLRFLFTSMKEGDIPDWRSRLGGFGPNPCDDGWYVDDVRVTQTLGGVSATTVSDTQDNSALPGCGATCDSLVVSLAASPASLAAPGRLVTLQAAATADRCLNGVLLFQFWQDGNGDGLLGDPSDRLLRDYGANPVFEDAPAADTSYIVRARCSSATGPPCDGVLAARSVAVSCPGTPFVPAYDPAAWWANLRFTGKTTFTVPHATQNPRLEAVRGDLVPLLGTGLFGEESCLADRVYGVSFTDASTPLSSQGYYYLVRDADAVCNDNSSWSTYHPAELDDAAPGRSRDTQIRACPP